MALLSTQDLTFSYGGLPLLQGVDLRVDAGERLALLGRNGTGKTTLMKVLAGDLPPDSGTVDRQKGITLTRLAQKVPTTLAGTVFDVVASGEPQLGALVAEYHHLSLDLNEASMARFQEVQEKIEAANGWQLHTRVETTLSRLGLYGEARFETLSGGLKRRVLMGRALVGAPDVLLLDEPTNHLDIEAIEWLEDLLIGLPSALLFVTHDRTFLETVATRILELDRGELKSYPGNYRRFLERREHEAEIEERHTAAQDRKLAQEEAWIRQGIKARRTRNEGRVRALEKLREEVRSRQKRTGQADLRIAQGDRSGKMVLEAKGLRFGHDPAQPQVKDLDLRILRGDKIGILGPNGSGKTTLIRLLLGQQEPDAGTLRLGSRLEVAYFDQLRETLDPSQTLVQALDTGDDFVRIGESKRHVIGYLGDFLFSPKQVRGPVEALSGGERSRLLLARLFARTFNVLVMDEPTNDLDIETLEILEARLVDFEGTLLIVSHDRTFLDNVVTSTLVMEGEGRVGSYAGGYSDWLTQRPAVVPVAAPSPTAAPAPAREASVSDTRPESKLAKPKDNPATKKKLSYKDKRDLEQLPERIEALEARQQELLSQLGDPDFYRNHDGEAIKTRQEEAAQLEKDLEAAYERWAELEDH